MGVIYRCGSDRRRALVAQKSCPANGIDYVEVTVSATRGEADRIEVYFLKAQTPLPAANFSISGPPDAQPAAITGFTWHENGTASILVADPRDASTYTLSLREPGSAEPPDNIDPRLAEVQLTFLAELAGGVTPQQTAPPLPDEPEMHYLAKDYASFRGEMLDRLALPLGGAEDQPAALQVALVELLAYTADRLSYYQDSVATDTYLGTARSRVSLRRHARLLNYRIQEGLNARVWIVCQTGPVAVQAGDDWQFLTNDSSPIVFEPCHRPTLFPQHNQIGIHAWGEDEFSLAAGATHAALVEDPRVLQLQPGNLVIFEGENAVTGEVIDHPVRLTGVTSRRNGVPLQDPVLQQNIVEIDWSPADALPVALAIQSGGIAQAARVLGNVILADHGASGVSGDPLTWRERLPADLADLSPGATPVSAAGLLERDARSALPVIALKGDSRTWTPVADLLENRPCDAVFVVETEEDGRERLRFGDGVYGRQPPAGAAFRVHARRGNGVAGNVLPNSICRVSGANIDGISVRNPLSAAGGQDPEPPEQIRLFAPQAFRGQQRALTAEDYEERAAAFPGGVARAAADIRWTGSWYTVYLFVDRTGGRAIDDDFKRQLEQYLDGYRLAGYDLEIRNPSYVPIEIELSVQVKPGFVPGAVMAALQDALGNQGLPGSGRGYFHPDNWSFGKPVYLSGIYGAALAVPGVAAIDVTTFQRIGDTTGNARENGVLEMGPHELVDTRHLNETMYNLSLSIAGGV